MRDPFDNPKAFEAFEEMLIWQQDGKSRLRGSFRATVVRGEGDSNSTGGSRDGIPADGYSILIDCRLRICGQISVGDTIIRADGSTLSVQQLTREHGIGVTLRCTADERASK